jgi:SAM-dependent methyltransferase
MKKFIRSFKGKQDFKPDYFGILVNPYFIIRYNLFKYIKKFSSKFINGKLLDFGCGSKPYQSLFNVDEYVGLDTHNSGHLHENEKIDVLYDGKKIPFDNDYFDYIFTSEVLEHVFNIDEVILELNRVLKLNGKILITVPFIWGEHEQPYDFARYTFFGLKNILEKNGFEIHEHVKTGSYVETIFQNLTAYLYHSVVPKGLRTLLTLILIAPLNILGIFLGKILPNNKTYYLNNIIVCKKIK